MDPINLFTTILLIAIILTGIFIVDFISNRKKTCYDKDTKLSDLLCYITGRKTTYEEIVKFIGNAV